LEPIDTFTRRQLQAISDTLEQHLFNEHQTIASVLYASVQHLLCMSNEQSQLI